MSAWTPPAGTDAAPVGRAARALRDFSARFYPLDALVFALFLFDRMAFVAGLPTGVAVGALIVGLGFTRKPRVDVPSLGWIAALFSLILAYLALESQYNGVDWTQRLIRIGLLFAVVLVLAQGRFDMYSAVIGLGLGAAANAVAFYVGVTPDRYPPFLTGFWGDKNVAGLWYAVVAVLGLMVFTRWSAAAWLAFMGGLVYLTGSRTSISALGLGTLWFLLRNHMGLLLRTGFAAVAIWVLGFAEDNLARVGVFADREGTDRFRALVEASMRLKVENAPWYGLGLSTSVAELPNGRVEFFHDSYAALRVEGGWPLLIAMVGIIVLAIGFFQTQRTVSAEQRAASAALVVTLVCAWKLGEVFFTSSTAIALGFAIAHTFGTPRDAVDVTRPGVT